MARPLQKILNIIFLLFGCILFIACNSKTVIDFQEEVKGKTWNFKDTMVTQFEVLDTTHYHYIDFQTRLNSKYNFSNLYLSYTLIGPSGMEINEIKTFDITDKSGKWLGSGFGELHSYALPLFQKLSLKVGGKYQLRVVQHMRVDDLPGIETVGVRIYTGNEIF